MNELPVVKIEAGGSPLRQRLKELYQYRELLWTLTYRDLRVKYAQTLIGLLWVLINPLLNLALLSFVFGVVAKVDLGTNAAGEAIPQLLYTLAGLCGWTYFSTVMADAGGSIIAAQGMVKKIYFPRLIIPLSKALTGLVDFLVVLLCMPILMLYYGFSPGPYWYSFPIFVFIALLSGLAAGIWMSALTIRFRDFQHITPLILRLGMYITPIAYPISAVPEQWRWVIYLNPLAAVVEGMRWALLGTEALPVELYYSVAGIVLLFLSGLWYFHRAERVMADIL